MNIELLGGVYESFDFPGGEVHVKVIQAPTIAHIIADIKRSRDIMTLLMLCDALKRQGSIIERIVIPYFPYARQDRVCNPGEALSVKVMADLINSIGANNVTIYDPHSDVTPALINNVEILNQWDIVTPALMQDRVLICPDAGAEKKIRKLSSNYVMCTKVRDTKTGNIVATKVQTDMNLKGKRCLIVDDICDGGRTFLEISKVLQKDHGVTDIALYITHGIFSNGLDVFRGAINEIWTCKEGALYRCL